MLSKTKLSKLFREKVAFDPRESRTMKVIMESGNREYYRARAIEAVKTGTEDDLVMAIRLLLLVVAED